MNDKPIINCHTHIFKGEHVPPYLAKTFVPRWLSFVLYTPLILKLYKISVRNKSEKYTGEARQKKRNLTLFYIWLQHRKVLSGFFKLIKIILTIHVLFIVFNWLASFTATPSQNIILKYILKLESWMKEWYLLLTITNLYVKILLVVIVGLFIKNGRNFIIFVITKAFKLAGVLPGKMTKDLISRYLLLGRFALYKDQDRIFGALKEQYAPKTKFIVLPMDMEYMDAGDLKPENTYRHQMQELADMKANGVNKDLILPFVFVEPRRIPDEDDYLVYDKTEFHKGKVMLKDCFIKTYIEVNKFNGFKIYPALGYYPFDEAILPLWKYAADKKIPIMTHCIKGTIFYRGNKKTDWDKHPIFKEYARTTDPKYDELLLPESKNKDFSLNFTHPLNYLVLLKEELLRIKVSTSSKDVQTLFGYNGPDKPMDRNLSHLKICLAHFGGEDQWEKYLEKDRFHYSNALIKKTDHGIEFLYTDDNKKDISWTKLENCWKKVDWYSIICSMMLQHKNVYADISYILHDKDIFDLLKQTINHPVLGQKVLFGTDFYVVRNHKAEKNLVVQTQGNLTPDEFAQIAQLNPNNYLYN
ncbi:hypothetical protein [Flavivirga jejuensis]|uniref:Amidohydrolase-related domain-containing protein n=1 Tax=Flavivirga jejuensis TaxID=870487 RepID=A0ABT8WN26_9FLAO|nr:hypothetical protein [Flavivirga jejuensis]MDO5974528.1 hypothetical protein [Flavivirga jejuensis]